jgi:putative SOS response-associated peptidase YedK|uniref:SOS response-associated peptidase n=1 Tax=Candidatus Planktophila sp. TaxID=2175601 RepID=UPI00404B293E
MCGRYAQTADMRELMEQFEVSGTAPQKSLPLNWNIAPTNPIYIVRGTSPDLATVSWGLIAPWLKTLVDARNSQSRAINARSESIFEKPTFKDAFRTTRCLIPASGYYEWATALGKYPPKQPFYISSKDDKQLPIAGIWSSWVGPSGEIIETASIITQEAQGQLEAIHSRMPVFMPKDRWQQWLDPKENNVDRLKSMMVVERPDLLLQARPVSHAVNSVARNGKELTVETPLGEPETLF